MKDPVFWIFVVAALLVFLRIGYLVWFKPDQFRKSINRSNSKLQKNMPSVSKQARKVVSMNKVDNTVLRGYRVMVTVVILALVGLIAYGIIAQ